MINLLLANVLENIIQNVKGTASLALGIIGTILIVAKLVTSGNKLFTAIVMFLFLCIATYFVTNPSMIISTGGQLLELIGVK
jgi:hypothetical protein